MQPKRTYTRNRMSFAQDDTEPEPSNPQSIYANKRRKPSPPSPDLVPRSHILNGGGKPHSRATASQGTAKKAHKENGKSKKFSGPILLPSDPMNVDDDDPFKSTLDFAKARSAPKLTAGSLYGGGRGSFVSYSAQLKNHKREQFRKAAPVHYISDDSSGDGGIMLSSDTIPSSDNIGPDDIDTESDDALSMVTMRGGDRTVTAAELSARIFAGREYTAAPTAPPSTTLWKDPIHPDSHLATTWTTNQSDSPFLRLPLSVRREIYAYALSSHSIHFTFFSYHNTPLDDGRYYSVPCMRYGSAIYHTDRNPLNLPLSHDVRVTPGMTLLNSVSRQLYLETHTLPYKLNDFYFEHNALFNHVVMDSPPRWTPQQRSALTSIVVVGQVPVPAILSALPKLQRVRVMFATGRASINGWYDVVRKGKRVELVKEPYGARSVHAGLGGRVGKGGMHGERGRTNESNGGKPRGKALSLKTNSW